jgi:tetratricopeptide (TPR) repeat protein
MSDPVIKGAKRSSSRPASRASTKSSAKARKLTAKPARPKPQRAAEKAPVRKAAPAKAAPPAKKTQPAKKKAQSAPKKSAAKARPAAASKKAPAPSKTRPAAKEQPRQSASAAKARAAAKPAPRPVRPAPPPPKQPSRDEAAALKAFERAHKEFARGHFSEARNLFRALIEQHAGVAEVTARARTYLTIAESRMRTEAALPRDPDSLYDRGVIELNRGDFVAAQEMFERALKRDPEAADTHYALAATRARLGAVETALQALDRAVELKPVLRIRAQADSDFAILRNEPDFDRIVFGAPRA